MGQLADALILLFMRILHNANMLNVHELSPQDFVGLSPAAAAQLAERVLAHFALSSAAHGLVLAPSSNRV